MPTYNIAGISIFIPDLNDITQSVVGPIESFISAVQQQIVAAVSSSLSFLSSLGSQVGSYLQNSLLPAIQSFFAPLQTAFQAAYSAVVALPGQILSAIQSAGSLVNAAISQVRTDLVGLLQTYVINPITQAQNFILSQLSSFASTISQDFAAARNFLDMRLQEVQQNVAAANQFLSNSVNQLYTGFQVTAETFANGFANLGPGLAKALVTELAALGPAAVNQVGSVLINALTPLTNAVRNELLQRLPHSPEEAVNSAISVAEIGLGIFISGEIAAIGLEALYPTKHLGITEAFHKATEILGIGAVTASLYEIIVSSGFKLRLEQYFNYNLQPRKISIESAQLAVYYQVRSLSDYATALRYEGYDDDAISAAQATIYKPLNARFLVKLLDEEIFDDSFYVQQLQRSGVDPALVPELLNAFKFMALKSYAGNAKQLIFQTWKDGFLDPGPGAQILAAFGVPDNQIKWIYALATMQYQYEQRLKLKDLAITELQKGAIDPGECMQELISIGMDAKRAAVEIRLAGFKGAPTLGKADRFAIAQEVLSIPVGL